MQVFTGGSQHASRPTLFHFGTSRQPPDLRRPLNAVRTHLPKQAARSLHSSASFSVGSRRQSPRCLDFRSFQGGRKGDRKSTRLNSSHLGISYAVFCLKKKKNRIHRTDKKTAHDTDASLCNTDHAT